MTAYPRKNQKVFGSGLTPAGNVAVFGSLQAGSPAYSNDPDAIQSLSNFLAGLNGGVIGNRSPAQEDLNGLFLLITQQIAYLLQAGVAEWNADTTYYANNFCRGVGTRVLYYSKTDDNLNNPVSDTNNWLPAIPVISPSAWVKFDGHSGSIIGSSNVASVLKNSTGTYTITFTNAFADANYAWSGSSNSYNGGSPTGGNNNIIIGGGNQLAGSLKVINWESTGGPIGPEDADIVCVIVNGN